MMTNFICLRPYFLLALLPVWTIGWYFWKKNKVHPDWQKICDPVFLNYFAQTQTNRTWLWTWLALMMSLSLFVIALAGPSWKKQSVKGLKTEQAVVIVWDLSQAMLLDDISPTRLDRSRILIQELLNTHSQIQWGLVVFSGMPFVVTPISNDISHILNFLPVLSPEILPIKGYEIEKALVEAKNLFKKANYSSGRIIVLSSKPPPSKLEQRFDSQIAWAWVNVFSGSSNMPQQHIWPITVASKPLNDWLNQDWQLFSKTIQNPEKMLQYEDMGRYFLFLGMLPLVMVFRKGWFLRLWV